MEQEWPRLRSAHAAVAADQLLEGGDLPELLVEGAVDEQVADVCERVESAQMVSGAFAEGRQGILSLDVVVGQSMDATCSQHERALDGRDHHEPDARMTGEAGKQPGVVGLDVRGLHPRGVHGEVDVGEVPAGTDDHIRALVCPDALILAAQIDRTVHGS